MLLIAAMCGSALAADSRSLGGIWSRLGMDPMAVTASSTSRIGRSMTVSGRSVTIVFPENSGRWESRSAAARAAPEEILSAAGQGTRQDSRVLQCGTHSLPACCAVKAEADPDAG